MAHLHPVSLQAPHSETARELSGTGSNSNPCNPLDSGSAHALVRSAHGSAGKFKSRAREWLWGMSGPGSARLCLCSGSSTPAGIPSQSPRAGEAAYVQVRWVSWSSGETKSLSRPLRSSGRSIPSEKRIFPARTSSACISQKVAQSKIW